MPSDLFGTVSSGRVAPQARRPSLLLVSASVHLLIFLVIVVASLRATGPLPEPRASVIYTPETRVVRIAEAREAPPHRASSTNHATLPSSTPPTFAPLVDDRAPVEPAFTIGDSRDPAASGLVAVGGPPQIGLTGWGTTDDGNGWGAVERIEARPPVSVKQPPRRLAPGIREPKKIVNVIPEYPRLAQAAHIQGTVILDIIVGERGSVDAVTVLRSVPALDQAAIDAVRRWQYEPGALNGTAIPVIITVTVNFSLGQ